jgi:hypothetical protein
VPGHKEYQNRPERITQEAWNRGYLEAFELARIAAWKSAQSVAAITVNKPEEIEDCTRAAMSVIKPWRGRKAIGLVTGADWDEWQQTANKAIGWVGGRRGPSSGLLSLKGVEYPMATAILDILDPTYGRSLTNGLRRPCSETLLLVTVPPATRRTPGT